MIHPTDQMSTGREGWREGRKEIYRQNGVVFWTTQFYIITESLHACETIPIILFTQTIVRWIYLLLSNSRQDLGTLIRLLETLITRISGRRVSDLSNLLSDH